MAYVLQEHCRYQEVITLINEKAELVEISKTFLDLMSINVTLKNEPFERQLRPLKDFVANLTNRPIFPAWLKYFSQVIAL